MLGRQVTVALRRPLQARLRTVAAPQTQYTLAIRTFSQAPRLLDPVGRPKKAVGEPSRPVKRAVKSAAKKPSTASNDAAVAKLAERKRAAKEREAAKKQKAKDAIAAKKAKALLPEEIEKKKKALLKASERELKKAALSPPQVKNTNAWSQFLASKGKDLKDALANREPGPDGKLIQPKDLIAGHTQRVSAAWKQITPSELEHMNHLAHTAKDATRAEYKRWVDSRSFEEIQIANRARRALQRRETKPKGVRTKWPIIEDERQPKQNMTAYTFFVSSRAKSGDFQNMKIVDVAPLIGKEWAALSEDEKAKFKSLADQDKARYKSELESVSDSSSFSDA